MSNLLGTQRTEISEVLGNSLLLTKAAVNDSKNAAQGADDTGHHLIVPFGQEAAGIQGRVTRPCCPLIKSPGVRGQDKRKQ